MSVFLLLVMGGMCWGLYRLAEEFGRLSKARPDREAGALWQASLHEALAPSLTTGAPAAVSNRMRICSYNIENFSDGIGDGRLRTEEAMHRQANQAAALVARINPDILVLQEIENETVLKRLNESFPAPFAVGYITRLGDQGHDVTLNLAVLSRVRIEAVTEIDFGPLKGTDLPPRGVLKFMVPAGDSSRILVYVVHLKSNYGSPVKNVPKRRKALQVVADDIRVVARSEASTREILVIGDMNVDPDTTAFAHDTSLSPLRGFYDLWRGEDLPSRTTVPTRHGNPARAFSPVAFDRILVSAEMQVAPWLAGKPQRLAAGVNTTDVDALPGIDPSHVSDHYPVYIDVCRLAPPSGRAEHLPKPFAAERRPDDR
jgi:endonuclease/exonuclease/phosphatase family metal-dependent hydrolase